MPALSVEATAGFEPAIEVLQTSALPLGYVALTLGILADSPPVVKPPAHACYCSGKMSAYVSTHQGLAIPGLAPNKFALFAV